MKSTLHLQGLFCWLLAVQALVCTGQADPKRWLNFYDPAALPEAMKYTPGDIRTNWLESVWPQLTADEKKALAGVQFEFPVQDGLHPMNFYSSSSPVRSVSMPLSSLRFLREMCLASAFLNQKGTNGEQLYNLKSFTDYLSILKYQWPTLKSQTCPYRPLEAMGIPNNAMSHPYVKSLWQKSYNSAVIFILCHELGHVRYKHEGNARVSPEESQKNEKLADEFALDLMRRIGIPPFGGATLTFYIFSHLDVNMHDNASFQQSATHPLSAERIRAVAGNLEKHLDEYSRQQSDPAGASVLFKTTIKELDTLAAKLSDEGVLELMTQIGYGGDICQVGLRRVGQSVPVSRLTNKQPFTGNFTGQWIDEHNQRMPISLSLYQNKMEVFGSGFLDDKIPIEVKDGFVEGSSLAFNWQMGKDYFGRGELKLTQKGLTGWWGTKKGNTVKKSGDLVFTRTH